MHRIAILDDDVSIRTVLSDVLMDEGYEVFLVEGSEDLLAKLAAARPDLVLLDWRLGAWGDGLALARAIRADLQFSHVRLIFMSAAQAELRKHFRALADLGCTVIEKPFDLDDLLARIAGACARIL